MDDRSLERVKKQLAAVGEDDFFSELQDVYVYTAKKSQENKINHFGLQRRILYISGLLSFVNVLITMVGCFSEMMPIIPVLSAIAAMISVGNTLLLGKKAMRKYGETWLRHQSHQAAMEFEMLAYAFKAPPYDTLDPESGAEYFIGQILKVWKANQQLFAVNMKNFDT